MKWKILIILFAPLFGFSQITGSGPISIGNVRSEAGASGAYSIGNGRTDFNLSGPTALSDFYGLSSDAINVSPSSNSPAAGGATWNVTVTATGAWEVTNKPTWLTMATSGSGNQTVSITASANNTGLSRNVSLVFRLTANTGITDGHSVFQFPL